VRKWLVGRGIGRRDFVAPWAREPGCAEGSSCEYLADHSHLHMASAVVNAQEWQEECGLAWVTTSRARK